MDVVIPVNKNSFTMEVESTYLPIKGMESFEISFDGDVQTWFELNEGGYQSALKTGLALSLSSDIKRHRGDAANDSIWATAFEVGQECNRNFKWILEDGTTVAFEAVVNISNYGGAGNDVATMSVDFTVIGKPEITEASTPSSPSP